MKFDHDSLALVIQKTRLLKLSWEIFLFIKLAVKKKICTQKIIESIEIHMRLENTFGLMFWESLCKKNLFLGDATLFQFHHLFMTLVELETWENRYIPFHLSMFPCFCLEFYLEFCKYVPIWYQFSKLSFVKKAHVIPVFE